VLKPFTAGHLVASIARQLCISPHTVRNHLQSIYRKAGVNGQAELMEKLHGTTE
jgi:DNA-binding CsgD family transcriptional regulator